MIAGVIKISGRYKRGNNSLKKVLLASSGTVLIMIAFLMPILILALGMIVDIGRALVFKAELNRACMIASEEATKEIDIDIAEKNGENILDESYEQTVLEYFNKNIYSRQNLKINNLDYEVIGGISDPRYIKVMACAEIDCLFLKIIGIDDIAIHSNACGRLKCFKD